LASDTSREPPIRVGVSSVPMKALAIHIWVICDQGRAYAVAPTVEAPPDREMPWLTGD
jgi:hypothetical protein